MSNRAARLAAQDIEDLRAQLAAACQVSGEIIWELTDRLDLDASETIELRTRASLRVSEASRRGPSPDPAADELSAFDALKSLDEFITEIHNRPLSLSSKRLVDRIQTRIRVALLTCMEAGQLE